MRLGLSVRSQVLILFLQGSARCDFHEEGAEQPISDGAYPHRYPGDCTCKSNGGRARVFANLPKTTGTRGEYAIHEFIETKLTVCRCH